VFGVRKNFCHFLFPSFCASKISAPILASPKMMLELVIGNSGGCRWDVANLKLAKSLSVILTLTETVLFPLFSPMRTNVRLRALGKQEFS
jgi:hypothetical protein